MRRHLRSVWLLLAASTLAGCTSSVAAIRVWGAESSVATARRTDAPKQRPYEFTKAVLYLAKAQEEEAYGRYGAAFEYAGLAEALADLSMEPPTEPIRRIVDAPAKGKDDEADDEAGAEPGTE